MEKIKFTIDKTKIIFLAFGCVFLLVACAYTLLYQEDMGTLMRTMLVVGIIVSVLEFIKLAILLRRKDQYLMVTESEIYCNLTKPPISLSWDEVEKLAMVRHNSKKKLAIFVKQPEKYLKEYNSSRFSKNMNDINTPFLIDVSILKIDAEELVKRINREISSEE